MAAWEGLVTNFQSLSPKDVRLPQVCPGTKKEPHYSGEMKGGLRPSCQESGDELAPPQKTVSHSWRSLLFPSVLLLPRIVRGTWANEDQRAELVEAAAVAAEGALAAGLGP